MRPRSGIASPHSENASLPQACWPSWSADDCACAGAQASVTAVAEGRADLAAIGYIVAAMTELISVGPPVAAALAIAAAAAFVVRRLAFAKRGADE